MLQILFATDNNNKSLTSDYINSLRDGKWGTIEPEWVNLSLAKFFFSKADKLGSLEGDPPTVSVFKKNKLLGYLFLTKDITSSKGYSSQVFDILVGLRLNGRLSGTKILRHKEPIIGMYTPEGQLILPKFMSQFKDLDIRVPTKVNLLRTEGPGSIDGISSATVSAVLFNGAILRAARIVALSKGLRLNDKPVVDIINFKKKSFKELISDRSISRLTINKNTLEKLGILEPLITNRSGVADIYRYRSLFKGNTPVAAKQKEVKKGYKDTDRNLILDLYLAPVVTPTIGRNLLGDKWYDIFVAGRDPKEMTIVIATLGRYPLDGEPNIASGVFKRLAIIQNKKKYYLSKELYRNLGFLHGEDKPFFAEAGIYRISSKAKIDPLKPWKLEILLESKKEEYNHFFYIDYNLDKKYIIQPDGISTIADKDEPIWYAAWHNQKYNIVILIFTLIVLTFCLSKIDLISENSFRRKIVRNLFLIWILFWLGWKAGGQITILSILAWISAPIVKPSWNTLLADPLLIIMIPYIFLSFFIWGRGLFCGWLCPFGALQELISSIAKYLKIPQLKVPEILNKYIINIKFFFLAILIFLSFYSIDLLNIGSEVEPFKTVISMKFQREWIFVLYATILLLMGVFIERFFCRFICPLGAFMVIGGKFQIFNFLKRRNECGKPCKLCAKACPIDAIDKKGKINLDECFYCLDCQSLYYNEHKCPPLVFDKKKNKLSLVPLSFKESS